MHTLSCLKTKLVLIYFHFCLYSNFSFDSFHRKKVLSLLYHTISCDVFFFSSLLLFLLHRCSCSAKANNVSSHSRNYSSPKAISDIVSDILSKVCQVRLMNVSYVRYVLAICIRFVSCVGVRQLMS